MMYCKNGKITVSQLDASCKLSLVGAFALVEDMVTDMLGEIELDGLSLKKRFGAIWVFTKHRMRLIRSLTWKDEYSAICRIAYRSPAKVLLDAVVYHAGEAAICSRVEMCAISLDSGKILRTAAVGLEERFIEGPLFDAEFSRLAAVEDPCCTHRVSFADIDYWQHTNNVEYVRFIESAFSAAGLAALPVKEIQIDYVSQSHEGDVLTVHRRDSGGISCVTIASADRVVINAELSF